MAAPAIITSIHTSANGLQAGPVVIDTPQGPLPAYRAVPDGPGPHPVVVLVQEIFGVSEHIRNVARRLAQEGYLAIAPALFHRLGDPAQATSIDELLQRFVYRLPDAEAMADLDAALDWALTCGGDAGRVGLTGFCWGGRITWLYAAHQPRLAAAVAWYGRLAGMTTTLQPRQPVDLAGALQCPVLGLYSGQDSGISQASVEQMRAALAAASEQRAAIHVYPDAPHAFFNDHRGSYRADLAQDGWQRLLAWFDQHGVSGRTSQGNIDKGARA